MPPTEYKQGNTITLTGQFYNEDGQTLVDALAVSLKLYDERYTLLATFTPTRTGTGTYEYRWTADRLGTVVYEFWGEVDGLPSLDRKTLVIKFV
jgi:hypothetical protein